MIRTVWLALICLISLGVMAAVRIGTASLARANVSDDVTPTEIKSEQPLMKSDKLEVLNIERALTKTTVTPIAILPPKAELKPAEPVTKIISRHWHDPLAPKSEPVTGQSKRKSTERASAR
jgi:hypothetical protein